MGRKFEIPEFYRSPIISTIKSARRTIDQRKKDLTPTILKVGKVTFKIARHFGFCYGVENAIEIAFRAIAENPGKRIFLLSEMIHNPSVNSDLKERGVDFLMSTDGKELIDFDSLTSDDIVIVPAFGTTLELLARLEGRGLNPYTYNTTCPFVEKVWNRAGQLGDQGYSIVIHGKHYHEETRATFSHARKTAPSVVIRNMEEALRLGKYISGDAKSDNFKEEFQGRYSEGFNPVVDLERIGVVNQTTMLAGETQEIAEYIKGIMAARYGEDKLRHHFADTRDTLCYATQENQNAIHSLVREGGDFAVVIGGYNSSNTSHLAKICSRALPTYYVQDAGELLSKQEVRHMDLDSMQLKISTNWLPSGGSEVVCLISAGASSPDSLVDAVILRLADLYGVIGQIEASMQPFRDALSQAA